MKRLVQWGGALSILILGVSCSEKAEVTNQPVYQDVAFQQDFSKKFDLQLEGVTLKNVYSDQHNVIQIYSSAGLLKTYAGEFLYPGTLVPDKTYRPMADKKIMNLDLYNDQFVYLEDKAVFSNAWAGNLYSRYTMPNASLLEGGEDFAFLISDGQSLQYLKDSKVLWQGKANGKIIDISFDPTRNVFWLLGKQSVSFFSVKDLALTEAFSGANFNCFSLANGGKEIIVGKNDGYQIIDADSRKPKGDVVNKLP